MNSWNRNEILNLILTRYYGREENAVFVRNASGAGGSQSRKEV